MVRVGRPLLLGPLRSRANGARLLRGGGEPRETARESPRPGVSHRKQPRCLPPNIFLGVQLNDGPHPPAPSPNAGRGGDSFLEVGAPIVPPTPGPSPTRGEGRTTKAPWLFNPLPELGEGASLSERVRACGGSCKRERGSTTWGSVRIEAWRCPSPGTGEGGGSKAAGWGRTGAAACSMSRVGTKKPLPCLRGRGLGRGPAGPPTAATAAAASGPPASRPRRSAPAGSPARPPGRGRGSGASRAPAPPCRGRSRGRWRPR